MLKEFNLIIVLTIAVIAIVASAIIYSPWPSLLVLGLLSAFLAVSNRRLSTAALENPPQLTCDDTRREHQLLLESIHSYPMPFAIYDEHDRLVVWNEHYENIYKKLFSSLKDKTDAKLLTYADVVKSNAEDKLSGSELRTFVQERVSRLRDKRYQVNDRLYPDLGWYRVVKYSIPSGGVAGLAIDIGESKQREAELLKEIDLRQKLEIEIRKIANTDELTNIANRRHLLEIAEREYLRCTHAGKRFTFLMIDIDNFKAVNDTYGHLFGDSIIFNVAQILTTELPSENHMVGRMGGEEFAVLLPDTPADEGEAIAENMRKAVENCTFVSEGDIRELTVSIGIAHRYEHDTTLLDLMRHADDALYIAKHAGRNQVAVAENMTLKRMQSG